MGERTTLQFPFQPGDLRRSESRAAWRSLRQDPGLAAFAPGPAPPLHRPLTHPQRCRDVPVLLPAREAFHGLQPDPLPRVPPSVGQPAALRVSHTPQLPEATDHRQKNSADITRSSSVAEEFVKSNIRLGGKVRASVDDRVLARFLGRPFAWCGLCGLPGYLLYDAGADQITLGVTISVGVVALAFILVYDFVDLLKSRKRVQ